MTGATRRVRALLGVRARRVILGVMLAAGAYLIETVAGLHPQAGLIVAQALGYGFGYGVRRVVVSVTWRGAIVRQPTANLSIGCGRHLSQKS